MPVSSKSAGKKAGAHDEVLSADAVPDRGDAIAVARRVAYVPAQKLPSVPLGFVPIDVAERRRRLQRVDAANEAELIEAAQELIERSATVRTDLGDLAPDLEELPELLTRVRGVSATTRALEALLDAHQQVRRVAFSDLHNLIIACFGEYEHRIDRRPDLAHNYPKIAIYGTSRGQAIAQGLQRARQTQDLVSEALANANPDDEGTDETDASPKPKRTPK